MVDRGIGLGRSVIGWRDAVARLAAIVTVTVIHCAVRVLIWKREEARGDSEEGRERESTQRRPTQSLRFRGSSLIANPRRGIYQRE